MPSTLPLGQIQPSIVIALLLISANCIVPSTGTHEFQGLFTSLNMTDHSVDSKASDSQRLTLAQLNAWAVLPQFAELAGKSQPYSCMRAGLFHCKSQRRGNSLRPRLTLLVWVTRFTCFRANNTQRHCAFFFGLVLCSSGCCARQHAT